LGYCVAMNVTSDRLALRFGNWSRGKLCFSNKVIGVESLQHASKIWCDIRKKSGAGASQSPIVMVVDTETGEHVAKISYNGRIWGMDGAEIV
jgi:hypothetical protein